jgi:hypothetical protein
VVLELLELLAFPKLNKKLLQELALLDGLFAKEPVGGRPYISRKTRKLLKKHG